MYEREDWMQFRSLTTLCQKAGVPPGDLPALVAKELADNALDASKGEARCEVGLLHDGGFWVADFGEGFGGTDAEIADLFSIKRPMRSSKLVRLPTRGALGNGLRVVAGAVLASAGSLVVHTRGRSIRLVPQDEGTTLAEPLGPFDDIVTKIEVRLGRPLTVDEDSILWARQAIALSATGARYRGGSSPLWYESEAFYELLQASPKQTVRAFMEAFDGCSGPKAGRIAADFKMRFAGDLTREGADRLLAKARENARVVKPERLGQLGAFIPHWPLSRAKVTGTYRRKAARGVHHAEIPFVLEAFAEVGEEPSIQVSVNRTPVAAKVEAFHHKDALMILGCGLDREFMVGRRPMRVWLNIETPYMPLVSDGKAPDLTPFVRSIRQALDSATKRAKKLVPSSKEADGLTTKDIILQRLDEAVVKASESGKYRFSIRHGSCSMPSDPTFSKGPARNRNTTTSRVSSPTTRPRTATSRACIATRGGRSITPIRGRRSNSGRCRSRSTAGPVTPSTRCCTARRRASSPPSRRRSGRSGTTAP